MQDHDGNQVPLAEHIRSILPSPIPNGVTEGVYQALFEMAGLADLPTSPAVAGVPPAPGCRSSWRRRWIPSVARRTPARLRRGTAPLPVPAATPARASPGAGTRLLTRDLTRATGRPPSTCPVSGPATDGRRQSVHGSVRSALLGLSVRDPAFDAPSSGICRGGAAARQLLLRRQLRTGAGDGGPYQGRHHARRRLGS